MTRHSSSRRSGYTLVELVVSMGSATVLLVGLASTLFIAGRAFDGNSAAIRRSRGTEVQAEMMADLHHALSFSERTAVAATFRVPDRDGDAQAEIIRYAWSGTAGDPLTYAYNGGAAATIAEDVQYLNLTYLNRFMAVPPLTGPLPLPSNEWGNRWQVAGGPFGYDTAFSNLVSGKKKRQVATQATLSVNGTLTAITAYVGGKKKKKYRFAIYTDAGGEPGTLIVETNTAKLPDNNDAWLTISVTPTSLTAGTYWLALSLEDKKQHYFQEAGGQTRTAKHDAIKKGYAANWGTSKANFPYKISIYGVYTPTP